jgi:hypothetical protein
VSDVFVGSESLDVGPPFVSNRFPTPGSVGVPVDTDVSFTVLDNVGGAGVDQNSIDVTIEGVDAIIDGVFQAGFTGSIVANGNGFDVTVNPDVDFPGSLTVDVDVFVADLAVPPNTVNDSWDFTTEAVATGLRRPKRWQYPIIFNTFRRAGKVN